ncbi:MAG: Uma2 family endonuclease, partial [Acidobacteria bacterium]|nr:Uma2 family endonuclease [Acidobacteriota bacterium]
MAKVPTRLMTAEEFYELDIPDGKAELVRGRVVRMSHPGMEHGVLVVKIAARLLSYVEQHALGYVTNETGFILARDPD